ncbi:MAG: GDSL-type esterase/lipase family protein [Thermodesulfobacteriota bacterium]
MGKTWKGRVLTALRWLVNIAIAFYVLLFLLLIWWGGTLVDARILGIRVSASDPAKPLAILLVLVFVRLCLSLELKNLVLLLFSCLVSLFLAEGALRILQVPLAAKPTLQAWRRPSPTLGYELIPGLSGSAGPAWDISVNSQGLRDRERTWAKPPGVFRVLCLGDSFTFGMGLPLEETYVKKIEEILNDENRNADVVNAGVIGYNLFQSLRYFEEKGKSYRPDLTVYFFFLDDAEGFLNEEGAEAYYRSASAGKFKEFRTPIYGPWARVHLFNFVNNVYTELSNKLKRISAHWVKNIERRREHFETLNKAFLDDPAKAAAFEKLLLRLYGDVRGAGSLFLVVLVPDAAQVHNPAMQNANRLLARLCQGNGIPFLDITPLFEREPSTADLYLFPVDAHTSALGDDIIARAVADQIRNMEDAQKADSGH